MTGPGRVPVRLLGAPGRLVDRRLPPGGPRRVLVTRVLAAAAAGLIVLVAVLSWSAAGQARTGSALAAALAAAVRLTPRLLTYDYRTMPADIARAEDATTGEFATQYRALTEQTIAPSAGAQQLVTTAEVRDSSVVSGTPTEVVVLVFLSQVTTTRNLTAPRLDTSAVRVRMSEVGGRWLISGLDRV